jgi:hypothetical protein
MRLYHEIRGGCVEFDRIVESIAGHHDRIRFFSFYVIVGRRPRPDVYLEGLASPNAFPQLINLMIRKKTIDEIGTSPGEHHRYHAWPVDFVIDYMIDTSSARDRALFLSAVEQCIRRRILFRIACVRSCNRRIDTEGHDAFLLMLQILRAKVLAYP